MTTLSPSRSTTVASLKTPSAHVEPNEAPVAFVNGTTFGNVKQSKILMIDDENDSIRSVQRELSSAGFNNLVSTNEGAQALRILAETQPDLVLLDVAMPTVDGLEVLACIRADSKFALLPVLVLTASCDLVTKRRALELGATDFLPKPVDSNDLIPRVRNALVAKAYHDRLTSYTDDLERQVRRRTAELTSSRGEIVHCLARAAEFRDDDTGHHVFRVGRYVGLIARRLGFPESYVELLELAAQLHDLGKIGIPDEILHKPGKLDPEQYAHIQKHCAIGYQIIQPLSPREWEVLKTHTRLGAGMLHVNSSPLLGIASKIAQTHHERWDGSGYPLGLAGEDIPIEGRMTAVADVYDALSSARPYKKPFARELCYQILDEGRNAYFDPKVLDAFFDCREEIIRVQLEYMDPVR
jgi:cyclic di-GMP phosphodiesterase